MNKIKNIIVSFSANDYAETPTILELKINEKTISNINSAKEMLKQNEGFKSIKIDADFNMFNEDEENEEESKLIETDWRADVQEMIITKYGIYLYAQCKYDAADQIESQNLLEIDEFKNLLN